MTWADTISELEYFTNPGPWDCYGEPLLSPDNLVLQAVFEPSPVAAYKLRINVLRPDGVLLEANAQGVYFDYVFFNAVIGGEDVTCCNIKMKDWSPAMCANGCFVLEVVVTTSTGISLFWKYTQRYNAVGCDTSLCGTPPLLVAELDDTETPQGHKQLKIDLCGQGPIPIDPCRGEYIRLEGSWPCDDSINGEYYGTPENIINCCYDEGNAGFDAPFPFTKGTWLSASFKKAPRELKRIISLNCKTQRVEVVTKKQMHGKDPYPEWKMEDVENILIAPRILVEGVEYLYREASPFERLHECTSHFRLKGNFELCPKRQTFGCKVDCEEKARYFKLGRISPNGRYYDEGGKLIATTTTSRSAEANLFLWLRTRPGVTYAKIIPTSVLDCTAAHLWMIAGREAMPTVIYSGYVRGGERMYGIDLGLTNPDYSVLCATPSAQTLCNAPVLDVPAVAAFACDTPVLSTPVVSNYQTSLVLDSTAPWVLDAGLSNATLTVNTVQLDFVVLNAGSTNPDFVWGSEWIGTISSAGRPDIAIIFDSTNSSLPTGRQLQIADNGRFYWTGKPISADGSGALIEIFSITYNV